LLLTQCTIQKRHYNRGFHIDWHTAQKAPQKAKNAKNNPIDLGLSPVNGLDRKFVDSEKDQPEVPPFLRTVSSLDQLLPELTKRKWNVNKREIGDKPDLNTPDSTCDRIILLNGDELVVRVSRVVGDSVEYTACSDSDTTKSMLAKSEIFVIRFSDGKKWVMWSQGSDSASQSNAIEGERPMHTLAILSFVFSMLGILSLIALYWFGGIGFIIGTLTGMTMGIIALVQMKQNPGKYRGKGFAILGLIIGPAFIAISFLILFLLWF